MGSKILDGVLVHNDLTAKSRGGTELLAERLLKIVPRKYFKGVDIHLSRCTSQNPKKKNILWCHDLANDPAAIHALTEFKWDEVVFVSNWQKQQYNELFQEDFGTVITNRIEPFTKIANGDNGFINLIYTSTPHRGLQILFPVFKTLCDEFSNLRLKVFSSFDLYGWEIRDEPYKDLFRELSIHPKVTYSKSVPNKVILKELLKSQIFVLPSIWPETSCLCLIEAMAAGLRCVHSDLAALPETSQGGTDMYRFHYDHIKHVDILYESLRSVIRSFKYPETSFANQMNLIYSMHDPAYLESWKNVFTTG